MKISREAKRQEALARLKVLTKKFKLHPQLMESFQDDKLYYSYLTGMGMVGSVEPIVHNRKYPLAVAVLEEKYNCLVYHVIEFGNTICMLYVGDNKEDWENEKLFKDTIIYTYVHNFDNPEYSEFGDINLYSYQGALLREIINF